jgi:threonine/homoserine/homoserine lactone efflux protein
MTFHTWSLYLVAAMALSLAPGPNGLLALSNGTLYGVRRAASATFGGACGFTLLIAVSATGVGALLQASTYLLAAMKWLGGAYLVWLGIQVWRSPSPVSMLRENMPARPAAVLFRQGFLAAVSNPKAILFFGAFLMQFVDPARSVLTQFAIMAATFVLVEIVTEIAIAALAQRIQGWLRRSGKRFNQVCGGLFMLIGAYLPWSR